MSTETKDALDLVRVSPAGEFELDKFTQVRLLDSRGAVHNGYMICGPGKDRNGIVIDRHARKVFMVDEGQYELDVKKDNNGNPTGAKS